MDGKLLLNGWGDRPTIAVARAESGAAAIEGPRARGSFEEPQWTRRTADLELAAGEHKILVEYANRSQEGLGYAALTPGQIQVTLRIDDRAAFRNEQPVLLDTAPQIFESRTFLPARFLAESFGLDVQWNGERREVTITDKQENKTIVLQIDNTRAYVNGKEFILDAAPRIVGDRTLVPVRFITEQIGATVGWENETRTVLVTR